jgi:hypothetical protein
MYISVDFSDQIIACKGVHCLTNKGVKINKIEDENHILLKYMVYIDIESNFHNIHPHNLLTHENMKFHKFPFQVI